MADHNSEAKRAYTLNQYNWNTPCREYSKRLALNLFWAVALLLSSSSLLYGSSNNALFIDEEGNVLIEENLYISKGKLQISNGAYIGQAIADSFIYDNKTMGWYSIGWMNDSWYKEGSTAWLTGFGGIKFFTGTDKPPGNPAMSIDHTGSLHVLSTNPIKFTPQWSNFSNPTDKNINHAEISNDTNSYKTLMIVGNRSADEKVRKVSVWDRLEVNGDLKATGTVTTGTIKTDTITTGTIEYYARYQIDDRAEEKYEISPRYHLSLVGHIYGGKTRSIPQNTLEALCGDPDGCEVRLAMTRWDNNQQLAGASRSFLFYYSKDNGYWRASNDNQGVDGDKTTQHTYEIWSTCYFTDGTYSDYKDQGDTAKGMQLLVWNGNKNLKRTCELTLID